MALSKTEKRALLVAINFMHKSGEHFVGMLEDRDHRSRLPEWQELEKTYKRLYKQIKVSLQKDIDNEKQQPPSS